MHCSYQIFVTLPVVHCMTNPVDNIYSKKYFVNCSISFLRKEIFNYKFSKFILTVSEFKKYFLKSYFLEPDFCYTHHKVQF